VPQELGLKVCILEDQYGFILHHHVMEHQTDDQVAVAMVADAKKKHGALPVAVLIRGFIAPRTNKILNHCWIKWYFLEKAGYLKRPEK